MDFHALMSYVIFFVETTALLGGILFIAQTSKTVKNSPERKSKATKSIICMVAYLILNSVRTSIFGG